jgi:hypothetical protein
MTKSHKWMLDRVRGLQAQKLAAGRKGFTSTDVHRAILRATRRGRLDHVAARRCMDSWAAQLANRPTWLKWQHYATAQLLEVARCRRHGHLSEARRTLSMVHDALKNHRKPS